MKNAFKMSFDHSRIYRVQFAQFVIVYNVCKSVGHS